MNKKLIMTLAGFVIFTVGVISGVIFYNYHHISNNQTQRATELETQINQHVMLLKLLDAKEYERIDMFLVNAIDTDLSESKAFLSINSNTAAHNLVKNNMKMAIDAILNRDKSLREVFHPEQSKFEYNKSLNLTGAKDAPPS